MSGWLALWLTACGAGAALVAHHLVPKAKGAPSQRRCPAHSGASSVSAQHPASTPRVSVPPEVLTPPAAARSPEESSAARPASGAPRRRFASPEQLARWEGQRQARSGRPYPFFYDGA